jgi:hypothetical protein
MINKWLFRKIKLEKSLEIKRQLWKLSETGTDMPGIHCNKIVCEKVEVSLIQKLNSSNGRIRA